MSNFVPTLERIALIKIVGQLWNENKVQKLLSCTLEKFPCDNIKNMISEHVDKLEIPSPLKIKIPGLIEPIGNQISLWLEYHVGTIAENMPLKMPLEYHWKPNGRIDSQKTVEDLVRNVDIDATHRYFWACYYSLENEIPIIWGTVDKTDSCKLAAKILTDVIVTFWTFRIDEDLTWIPSPMLKAFEMRFRQSSSNLFVLNDLCYQNRSDSNSLLNGSDSFFPEKHRYSVAAEYFWRKLTTEEKQQFSSEFTVSPLSQTNDVIYFIFSELDDGNQSRVLREHHEDVLVCFLDWPRHTRFLDVVKGCWSFLTARSLNRLLGIILEKARMDSEGYAGLFEEFWNQCPANCVDLFFHAVDLSNEIFVNLCSHTDRKLILSAFIRTRNEDDVCFRLRAFSICLMLFHGNFLNLFKEFVTENRDCVLLLTCFRSVLQLVKGLAAVDRPNAIDRKERFQTFLLVLDSISEERNGVNEEE